MIKWHLETRLIKDLKPHPKNPRQLSKDQARQLGTSMWAYGLVEKPVINTDNMIIGGHQRIQMLKSMKIKECECWVPDRALLEREVDELNIRLNRNHGEFDYDILANSWDVPDLLDWGFHPEELELIAIDPLESEDKQEKKKRNTLAPLAVTSFNGKNTNRKATWTTSLRNRLE